MKPLPKIEMNFKKEDPKTVQPVQSTTPVTQPVTQPTTTVTQPVNPATTTPNPSFGIRKISIRGMKEAPKEEAPPLPIDLPPALPDDLPPPLPEDGPPPLPDEPPPPIPDTLPPPVPEESEFLLDNVTQVHEDEDAALDEFMRKEEEELARKKEEKRKKEEEEARKKKEAEDVKKKEAEDVKKKEEEDRKKREEEDRKKREEDLKKNSSSTGSMFQQSFRESFSRKRIFSIARDKVSKSLETYEELEEIECLNPLYQVEGLQEQKKTEDTSLNREGNVFEENPLPCLAEELEAFETGCGVFERPFLFTEKELPKRNNPPVSFYTLLQIEEFDKLLGVIIDTKPPPERVERVRAQSIMLQQKSFTGSAKNLNELRKTDSSESLPKVRAGRTGTIMQKAPSQKSLNVEYDPDFDPPFMNPLYDPEALSEEDQVKKNLLDAMLKIIEENDGNDPEVLDIYQLDLDQVPTLNEEVYNEHVRKMEAIERWNAKASNKEGSRQGKYIVSPFSTKKPEAVKKTDDDYEEENVSITSKRATPQEIVNKLIAEVKNLKKRALQLELFVDYNDDELEDKGILDDYGSFDPNATDIMEEIHLNAIFADEEISEHFTNL